MSSELRRGLLAVLPVLVVLVVAACGDHGGDTSAFCTDVRAAEDAFSGLGSMPASFGDYVATLDAARQSFRDITPPAEIAGEWNSVAAAAGEILELFEDFDLDDPEPLAGVEADVVQELQAIQARHGNMSESSDRISEYLSEECGIDVDG